MFKDNSSVITIKNDNPTYLYFDIKYILVSLVFREGGRYIITTNFLLCGLSEAVCADM